MNLHNLIQWCIGIVLAWSAVSHIEDMQMAVWKAQAALLYEARASNWGSPKFFLGE